MDLLGDAGSLMEMASAGKMTPTEKLKEDLASAFSVELSEDLFFSYLQSPQNCQNYDYLAS